MGAMSRSRWPWSPSHGISSPTFCGSSRNFDRRQSHQRHKAFVRYASEPNSRERCTSMTENSAIFNARHGAGSSHPHRQPAPTAQDCLKRGNGANWLRRGEKCPCETRETMGRDFGPCVAHYCAHMDATVRERTSPPRGISSMSEESPVEHFEHAEHAAFLGDPFLTRVSITIAILAVAAATVGSLETLQTASAMWR